MDLKEFKCAVCPHKKRHNDDEILRLFYGMTESMQTAVKQIMEVTQERTEDD